MKYIPSKEKFHVVTDDKSIFCTTSESEMADVLAAMNTIVLALNDEEAYFENWFDLVPEDADHAEFEDTVKNLPDLVEHVIARFAWIIKHYVK